MKVFVVLASCLVLVAALDWRRTNVGDDWRRDRFGGDLGMDDRRGNLGMDDRRGDRSMDDTTWTNRGRFDTRDRMVDSREHQIDSRERLDVNIRDRMLFKDNIMDTRGHDRMDDSLERNRMDFDHRDVTVKNVDKKLVKHDDEIRMKILGDKNLILKQKFILDVLRNVHKTWTRDDKDMDGLHIVEGDVNYKNFDNVIDFFRMWKIKGMLPRGRVFSINNKVHRRETNLLFNLFFYSKDFGVFQRNVLWARRNVNEGMFVHALTAAILHRDDCLGIKLPALYEILPHKFHTSMTIEKALNFRRDNVNTNNDLVILNKYTTDYMPLNEEGKLAYLTEDIGWNMYHFYFHLDFASWIGGKDFKLVHERRGERYLNLIQQLLARYNLERLSVGLGDIKDISLLDRVKTGYNPLMRYSNGLPVTFRKNYYDIRTTEDYHLMNRVDDFGRRIRDAIDKGYCTTIDGGKVDLKRSDAIDILGNMIQTNKDSVNVRYFGGFIRNFAKLLGGGHIKDVNDHKITPTVMEHHETALRDPVTYQLYKKVMKMYYQFKDNLPVYKKEDLLLNGVRVDNIKVSKLVTYFDHFDVDISSVVDTTDRDNVNVHDDRHVNTVIKARHMRLNHKPFNINIDITCNQPQKVVVRTFLGPKFDVFGKKIKLRYNRDNFVEIDKMTYDLKGGRDTITRNSRDFVYTVKDRTTILDIYKLVLLNNDANKLIDLHIDEANCGFPDRLLLPKGWVGGLPMQIFVIVTKAKDVVKRDFDRTMICGKRTLIHDVDDNALGFPFDRRIDETEFYTTNMFFKDVHIFHDTVDVKNVDLDGRDLGSYERMMMKY